MVNYWWSHDQVGSSFGGSGGGCIRGGSPGGENRVKGPGTQGVLHHHQFQFSR